MVASRSRQLLVDFASPRFVTRGAPQLGWRQQRAPLVEEPPALVLPRVNQALLPLQPHLPPQWL